MESFEYRIAEVAGPAASARTPRKVLAVTTGAAYGTAAVAVALEYRCLLKPRGKAGLVYGSGLGAKRYVIARSMAWLGDFRRPKVCNERTWHGAQGLHELAARVVWANRLRQVRATQHSRY